MERDFYHFSAERLRIASEGFYFHCHPQVSCYLVCCHRADISLYPYDIIRLKRHLGLHSADFIFQHTRISEGSHPFFPGIKLNMSDSEGYPCPFLGTEGCRVYADRPSACRTYPLERGVEKISGQPGVQAHYRLTRHQYCKGHEQIRQYTIQQWERDQKIDDFNLSNDRWAELDAFFASNPWAGEGKAGPLQQLAFMVCYNIDGFRAYAQEHALLKIFDISKDERQQIEKDDASLLHFGFRWLEHTLGGRKLLKRQ